MDLSLSSQWYLSSQIVIEKSASASYSRSHTNGGQLECYRPLQFLRKRRVVLLVHYLCHQHPNWTGSFLVPMTCDLALALCVCRDIHIKIYIYTQYMTYDVCMARMATNFPKSSSILLAHLSPYIFWTSKGTTWGIGVMLQVAQLRQYLLSLTPLKQKFQLGIQISQERS